MEAKKRLFFLAFATILLASSRFVGATTRNENDQEEWGHTNCLYKNGNDSVLNNDVTFPSELSFIDDTTTIVSRCKFCFTLWKEDSQQNKYILNQGCWLNSDGCSVSGCVQRGNPHPALSQADSGDDKGKFCCCSGDQCNNDISTNATLGQTDVDDGNTETQLSLDGVGNRDDPLDSVTLGLITFCAVSTAGLVCLAIVWMKWRRNNGDKVIFVADFESCDESMNGEKTNKHTDLSSLTIDNIIGQGKYGIVYKGQIVNQADPTTTTTVAVKVFAPAQKKAFLEEREIYELSRMANPSVTSSLLKYFGSVEVANINETIYDSVLVVSYADHGSLLSFLKCQTVSWSELCRMLQNIAHGLAALHSGFEESGNKNSPSICHRDLNSRNILVRSDLSCCIADFGFSIRLRGSTYYQDGHEISAESGTLSDVGTVRYLAPELLEGTLNLCDAEASLKQADVYALGLVFWELSRRCRDLYQGASVANYEQAYEQELGCLCPGFEQMKNLVARNRARPLFPEIWKKSNPAIRQLQETIEDSWDHDGEARLTSACVLERVNQLPGMWDRYKLNSHGPPSIESTIPNHSADSNMSAYPVYHVNNELDSPKSMSTSPVATSPMNLSMSTSSTNSNNDVDESVRIKNDNILSRQQPVGKIQPYQGRNICLERNLMSESDSSEECPLIEKSSKDLRQATFRNNFVDETSRRETSRIQSPLNLMPHQNAIPFVRNDFSVPEPPRNKNVTNQMTSHSQTSHPPRTTKTTRSQASSWFRNLKKAGDPSEKSNNSVLETSQIRIGEKNSNPSATNPVRTSTPTAAPKASNANSASKMC